MKLGILEQGSVEKTGSMGQKPSMFTQQYNLTQLLLNHAKFSPYVFRESVVKARVHQILKNMSPLRTKMPYPRSP